MDRHFKNKNLGSKCAFCLLKRLFKPALAGLFYSSLQRESPVSCIPGHLRPFFPICLILLPVATDTAWPTTRPGLRVEWAMPLHRVASSRGKQLGAQAPHHLACQSSPWRPKGKGDKGQLPRLQPLPLLLLLQRSTDAGYSPTQLGRAGGSPGKERRVKKGADAPLSPSVSAPATAASPALYHPTTGQRADRQGRPGHRD